ncbi:hypothetical protein B0J11DRAFT_597522 [Dendryphion nanum]|uniref:N-acetyltransferase domain-containing protein n=1 Tax=Dendryphion nanum TaxID=256645 RepID=A0A9P9IWG1_9PLEO|nr:hypothetical protein B0J11DRAFT_597522 [Dendryphion nanum]
MPEFHIRGEVLPEDADFILEAFDSTQPHLASIGSGTQWGTEPMSKRDGSAERIRSAVEKARSGSSDKYAIFIAEVHVDDGIDAGTGRIRIDRPNLQLLQVGAAIVHQGSFPDYVAKQQHLDALVCEATERADYLYLYALVSDYRTGSMRKGAGAVLAQRVRDYAQEKGKAVVYVDCWAGNGEKLVEFYKSQGFVPVGGYDLKKDDGTIWPGKLLRMDIEPSTSREE